MRLHDFRIIIKQKREEVELILKTEVYDVGTRRTKYDRPYFSFKKGEIFTLSKNPDLSEGVQMVALEDTAIPFYTDIFFNTKRLRCHPVGKEDKLTLLDTASDFILGYIVEAMNILVHEEIKTGQPYHTQMKKIRDDVSKKYYQNLRVKPPSSGGG